MVQNQLQVGWPTVFIISLERRNPKSFHLNENLWNLHSANALGMQVAFDRRIGVRFKFYAQIERGSINLNRVYMYLVVEVVETIFRWPFRDSLPVVLFANNFEICIRFYLLLALRYLIF